MDVDITLAQKRKKYWAAYQALADTEQAIMHMMAVIYEPVSRTKIVNCLNKTGMQTPQGRALSVSYLKPFIEHLEKAELVEEVRGRGLRCSYLIVELIARTLVKQESFTSRAKIVQDLLPLSQYWGSKGRFETVEQFIRELRLGLYQNDDTFIKKQVDIYQSQQLATVVSVQEALSRIYQNPFDKNWFEQLPFNIFAYLMVDEVNLSLQSLTPINDCVLLTRQRMNTHTSINKDEHILWLSLQLSLARLDLLQGDIQSLEQKIALTHEVIGHVSVGSKILQAHIAMLQGHFEQSRLSYEESLKLIRQSSGSRKVFLKGVDGIFLVLSGLQDHPSKHQKHLKSHIDALSKAGAIDTARGLNALVDMLQGQPQELDYFKHNNTFKAMPKDALGQLVQMLCLYWTDVDSLRAHSAPLHQFYENLNHHAYLWLAAEVAEILGRVFDSPSHLQVAAQFREKHQILALADLITTKAPWEHALQALLDLNTPASGQQKTTETALRLVWFIKETHFHYTISPKEQKQTAKGGWTKGRSVALKRLVNPSDNELSYLTPQDLSICQHIREFEDGYYGQTQYKFDDNVMLDMVGHPLAFWEGMNNINVEIVKSEPQLLVKKNGENTLDIQVEPLPKNSAQSLIIKKETPTRLNVIKLSPQFHQLMNIIGEKGLSVPVSAKQTVIKAVSQVSSMVTIHSDIDENLSNATRVEADAMPHLHLLPFGEGLKMMVLVQPFSSTGGGPYYVPGEGAKSIIADINGQRVQTSRDLLLEKQQAEIIDNTCPVIHEVEQLDGECLINDPEQCLELLIQLQHIQDDVQIEWPEGEKFKLKHQVGIEQFKLSIHRENDWFSLQGELNLSADEVMDMRSLLELLDHSPGRFIKVGDNEFMALTDEFRQRLNDLRGFSDIHGQGTRIHPLAAPVLEDFFAHVGELQVDQHWQAHIQSLREMEDFKPQLPSTLQAELRDYQLEGFNWLARLAHWGVGACLADDMGLGKTLQGLSVILSRAPKGPSLVVAPTSVCMNWLMEAHQFAPTLRPLSLGSGDRQKMLDELQAFDLLVCSYGLLQQEEVAEKLAKIEFQTIILDEAQAIKNAATKRSQAAMQLQAGFKCITTGTPIENHLGELWNLFRFINPGLLGSLEKFNSRFAIPIERDHDRDARHRLKRLIQPFILRRTKSQVLSELPERTEIMLQIELSKEELAFYEALRQKAVQTLSMMDAPEGHKQLQILAEIMRLRRACCHPRLVKKDIQLSSSKLKVFAEVVEELLDNQHKALVFSQFVDHLNILREYLDSKNISYQYLDGSTPAKARQTRVQAFQAGEGDVFLISLKAGGVGLNLTAADYVIHMDPWWNPAVEDQASDRAHRIGQQRPVTIYRLVAQNTIEEKIVALHHQKRDLADSLLDGSDMSGKLSAKDLLNLLREE